MKPDTVAAQTKAIRAMSVEQKLRLAESLRAFAWEIKRAAIHRRHPELREADLLVLVRAAFGHDRA